MNATFTFTVATATVIVTVTVTVTAAAVTAPTVAAAHHNSRALRACEDYFPFCNDTNAQHFGSLTSSCVELYSKLLHELSSPALSNSNTQWGQN